MKPTHKREFVTVLFICMLLPAVAQEFDTRCWLTRLDDGTHITRLSIPGAHNAATGEGFYINAGFGKTQNLDLSALWDCGIRFFDLRPAVDGNTLHIYHGPLKTRISFNEALKVLCDKLEQHPREFAIVLVREEKESESREEQRLWPQLVGEAIENLGEKAALFLPAMKIGDIRGKILFMSRNHYTGSRKGAIISGWGHAPDDNSNASMTSLYNGYKYKLVQQDYYDTTNSRRLKAKCNAVASLIDAAGRLDTDVWTINFLSAYSTTWLGISPFATTAGYKRNAQALNGMTVGILKETPADKRRPLGILVMDFAGTDKVKGGICHWSNFEVYGKTLVETIIEYNFH